MGTRGLNVVVSGGQVKVANYNQWDSYPSGQGIDALTFLREEMKSDFKQKVDNCSWISEEEMKDLWKSVGHVSDDGWVSVEISKKFSEKYPWLHRDCGAQIYGFVQNSENGLKTRNSLDFAADSLFCEWAYVVDLDKKTFEVYKGFNKTPLTAEDRFFSLQKEGEDYCPVKMVKSYSLDNLPSDEDFIKECEPQEEYE
jgi:hypothetical protein